MKIFVEKCVNSARTRRHKFPGRGMKRCAIRVAAAEVNRTFHLVQSNSVEAKLTVPGSRLSCKTLFVSV